MTVVVKVENVSKKYQLGDVGTQSLKGDFQRWWARVKGKEDPFTKVGQDSQHQNGEFWALKDINFEVNQGDAIGIIGKNGAGKSTLLKILSRITNPTTGSVKIKGRIASLLEVGTGFNPDLTGRDNIFLNGAILGMTKREISAKFDEIVDFSGIEKFIDTPVKRYSSGMYVRLAFAVAAHLESEILILDEVLAVGDAEFQKKCLRKMDDVAHKQGRTILFVSHSMASVRTLCNKGILLKKGKIQFWGEASEAVDLYTNIEENDGQIGIALDKRTDRVGNGALKFVNISFFNSNLRPISEVISGDPLVIKLDYVLKEQYLLPQKLILGVNFFDEHKNMLTALLTDEMGSKLKPLSEKGSIYCKIHKLTLRGGHYSVRLFSSYQGTGPEHMLDVIEEATFLHVLPGDFWRSGKVNRPGSHLLMEGEFTN